MEEKEKSKLAKILVPKLTSFLPVSLGVNTARYSMENNLKRYEMKKIKIDKYDKKRIKISSITNGAAWELIRDVPTAVFLWAGDLPLGLGYYAGASYLIDRVASVF
jgi:hypothetical protein